MSINSYLDVVVAWNIQNQLNDIRGDLAQIKNAIETQDSRRLQYRLEQVAALIKADILDEAQDHLNDLIRESPADPRLRLLQFGVAIKRKDFSAAEKNLEVAQKLGIPEKLYSRSLAVYHGATGQKAEAEKIKRKLRVEQGKQYRRHRQDRAMVEKEKTKDFLLSGVGCITMVILFLLMVKGCT